MLRKQILRIPALARYLSRAINWLFYFTLHGCVVINCPSWGQLLALVRQNSLGKCDEWGENSLGKCDFPFVIRCLLASYVLLLKITILGRLFMPQILSKLGIFLLWVMNWKQKAGIARKTAVFRKTVVFFLLFYRKSA